MNKYKKYIIILICILILSISGTFAWYVWKSTNTYVSLGICVPEISFIGGTTLNGNDLMPTLSREKGLKKQIDVYLNKTCKEGDSGVMNLYMKLDVLPVELQHETFMFEVVKDDEVLYSNNFSGKKQGDTVELLTNQVITENDSIYLVYVYIDGTRDNPGNMMNKSFKFTIYGEGTGAIYKNNVMEDPESTPSSGTSTFLNTSIARNTIQSITIAKDNTVPDDITEDVVDISSTDDGSVLLWYKTNIDENGKKTYDIYMGSENGIIETNINGQGMFAYLENVQSLDLTNLDTSNITNMSSMFQGSSSLKEIKLSNFNTSNVTSMNNMFMNCISLTCLDLSNFNVSNVTTATQMFQGCSNLVTLNLSNWNTSNLTTMLYMFYKCSALKELDLSSFDVSKVTSLVRTFWRCSSLQKLDLTGWNTSNLTNMERTFADCSSLMTLDLGYFNTSKVTDMQFAFSGCNSLKTLNVSSFNTGNVKNMGNMFSGCSKLENLDLIKFDTSNVTNMGAMFDSCGSLTSLNLRSFNTSNVTSMAQMFANCRALTSLDLSHFVTTNVTTMYRMFINCAKLVDLNLSSFTTANVTSIDSMFHGCSSLNSLDFRNADFSIITNANAIFNFVPSGANGVNIIIDASQEQWFNTKYSAYTNLTLINNSGSV